jgi:hypothetical protein
MLVDADEQPVAGELVQVCGTDLCVPGESSEDGSVTIQPNQALTRPAFKFGEGVVTPRFAWLLPPEPTVALGVVHTVRLPDISSGVPLQSGATVTSGGLTLTLPDGGRVEVDRLTFRTDEEQAFRAVQVPLEHAPEVIGNEFELVYAGTPTDTVFCPPAQLIIENSEGWPAGTDVEVYLHGVDIEEEWAPYGGWGKVSDARVSDDGARIETTSPGLPLLGVLGFKRR